MTLRELRFEFAHAREVLIEPVAVGGADILLEFLRAVADEVEQAAPGLEVREALVNLLGLALHEHFLVERRGAALGRNADAASRVRHALPALGTDEHDERGEARDEAESLGDELIERDAALESGRAGVRRRGEECFLGFVRTVHIGV